VLKTVGNPQVRGPAPLNADGQVRPRVRHCSANDRDGAKSNVTVTCERLPASAFVARTKPTWKPGDATHVSVEELHATYLPPLLEVET
jgi:hypothetical protein